MLYSSLLLIAVICIPGYASGTDIIPTENPVPGHYIVTLKDEQAKQSSSLGDFIDEIIQRDDMDASSHGTVAHVFESVFTGFAAELDETGLQNVLDNPNVVSVEEDGYVQLDRATWGLDRIDDVDLPLDGTYKPTFGNNGQGVTAYIIDTGVLHTHTEFENRATQEYNSVGDGKNYDCHGHGTHVAGTVGSKNYGVANKAKLVGVKVLSCSGSGTWSGVIAGVNWVKANAKKPATANMSLGGGKNTALNTAVKALVASGVSTVVAAGNSNRDACSYSPASEPDAITVGATTNGDSRANFSNWGRCLDIFAPGQGITAPWIGSNTALRTISGTSMASPHVCGAAALYLGQDKSLSPDDVLQKMLDNSIADTIMNVGTGSPNQFLHVGADHGNVLVHLQSIGDKIYTLNQWAGTKGESRRLEGFQIRGPSGISIEYMASLRGRGDTPWTSGYVGTRGQSRPLEGFAIRLKGESAKKWSVEYAAYLAGTGDTSFVKDGEFIGTRGKTSVEAIYIRIEPKESTCRDGKIPLEITVIAGDQGDENSVSMKVMTEKGWRKRKAIYKKGFKNNAMTKIDHCIRSDKCYKIAIKDKEGDGMSDGEGSYKIAIDGETVKFSKFDDGSKETYEINC